MKTRIFLTIAIAGLVYSCTGVKRGQKALYTGDYNTVINLAIDRLSKGKDKKADQEQVVLLEDAFQKITVRDRNRIQLLQGEKNPAHSREIYNLLYNLNDIQERIAPLLPLHRGNREAHFQFHNYNSELWEAKSNFAANLYDEAQRLMQRNQKMEYRKAFALLTELEQLSPQYQNADQLLREAHYHGTDFVFVSLKNQTHHMIPHRLERDLLDFNTYGLDDFWTEYHSLNRRDIDYDFDVILEFRDLKISPERVIERIVDYEKEILDGYTYQTDRRGNYVVDSLGNRIKIDRYITVKARLFETVQTKSLALDARVFYRDNQRQQNIHTYPLGVEFIFENIYAQWDGDKRALPTECLNFINNRPVPFPTNEQMLIDASGDIKSRLASILKNNKFR